MRKSSGKHTGPTLISELVEYKADSIRTEFCDILDPNVPSPSWERVTSTILPQGEEYNFFESQALELLTQLVLYQLCNWDARIMELIGGFPEQLLRMLVSPPQVECPLRKEIAQKLLDTDDSLLVRPRSDIAYKLKPQ